MDEGFWAKILNPGGRRWDPVVTPLVEGITSESDEDSHGKVFVTVEYDRDPTPEELLGWVS